MTQPNLCYRFRAWLRKSAHFHIRERRVASAADAVALIDRFVDGRLEYDLEWDDFISWNHEDANIEIIRETVSQAEPLLFSRKKSDRIRYIEFILAERNKLAQACGISVRSIDEAVRLAAERLRD